MGISGRGQLRDILGLHGGKQRTPWQYIKHASKTPKDFQVADEKKKEVSGKIHHLFVRQQESLFSFTSKLQPEYPLKVSAFDSTRRHRRIFKWLTKRRKKFLGRYITYSFASRRAFLVSHRSFSQSEEHLLEPHEKDQPFKNGDVPPDSSAPSLRTMGRPALVPNRSNAIPSSKVTEMAATILMRSQQVVSLLPTVSILNILCSENKRPGP
ncbi:hypothetical protein J6590_013097 [Homalodisca vitripennis]|nr:hypothetical protein J6590_013097 [Homalodisca vitripennis]